MKRNIQTQYQSGSVGLLVLLVSVAIIGVLLATLYMQSHEEAVVEENGTVVTVERTGFEKAKNDVEAAKGVQDTVDTYTSKMNSDLKNIGIE